jgi:hypothetical protein
VGVLPGPEAGLRVRLRATLLLAGSLVAASLGSEVEARQEAAAPSPEATVASVSRWLEAVEQGGDEESRAMLEAVLEVAGESALPVLFERLRSSRDRGSSPAACWALGELLRPPPAEPPSPSPDRRRAVTALVEVLERGSADSRLAAVSALGLLEARQAEPALLDLAAEPGLGPAAEDVVLLALAGLRSRGLSLLEGRLERGGGTDWSEATTLSFLRWGGTAWPELVRAARSSPDERVRATALTTLLLLAEPASACELIELYGLEPVPVLRRVLLQAISATRHPLARDHLALVARTEAQSGLRQAAALLVEGLSAERSAQPAPRSGPRRPILDLLAELERRPGFARQVQEVEARADARHVERIGLVLRRLPLRSDGRRLEDHARLAQLRARLLCLDGLDCAR